jgi:hypothetical protein
MALWKALRVSSMMVVALYSGRQHGATYAPQFGVIASR